MQTEVLTDTEFSQVPMVREPPPAETMNPLTLIARAVERGMDPMQLKALIDLQHQWEAGLARKAYAQAMVECQSEMPCIVRDGWNDHTKSRFARLETISQQAKPIYQQHGFALEFSEGEASKAGYKRIVCKVIHRDGHSEQKWIEFPIDGTGAKGGKSSMNEVQGCVSTDTYGKRVLTCNVFNITIADTDLDGQPPAYDNPEADPNATKAQPRGKRPNAPQPLATEVSEQQLAHLVAHWKAKNPDPDGNLVRQGAAFKEWAMGICDHIFNPRKVSEWSLADYTTCCNAVGCEVLNG